MGDSSARCGGHSEHLSTGLRENWPASHRRPALHRVSSCAQSFPTLHVADTCRSIPRWPFARPLLRLLLRSEALDSNLRDVTRLPPPDSFALPQDSAPQSVLGRDYSSQACSIPVMRPMTATKSFQLCCFERSTFRPSGVRA